MELGDLVHYIDQKRWKRHLLILKKLARVKKGFPRSEQILGINNTALSHNLDMLRRLGYVSKQDDGENAIIDPMIAEFVQSLWNNINKNQKIIRPLEQES